MTKIISVSDEAYESLKRLKKEKSFSEIIIEIAKEKDSRDIMTFAGILTKEEAEKMKKNIYEERKIPSRRFR